MLTTEEKQLIEAAVLRLVTRSSATPAEVAQLLMSLPPKPGALDLALDVVIRNQWVGRPLVEQAVAHFRSLAAAKASPQPAPPDAAVAPAGPLEPAQLAALLESEAAYPQKVDALMTAIRVGDTRAAAVVRARLGVEQNPFIVATIASVLGQLGDASDGERLVPLLRHADARVVANALEALNRRGAHPPIAVLTELVDSEDNRIRTNALALFGRTNATLVLERLPGLSQAPDVTTRSGAAYLLGELVEHDRARELLVEMLQTEDKTPVLKRIAASLKKHAGPASVAHVIAPLWELKHRVSGAKQAMVAQLLQEIAVDVGWTEAQVEQAGRGYVREQHASAARATGRMRALSPEQVATARQTGKIKALDPGAAAPRHPQGISVPTAATRAPARSGATQKIDLAALMNEEGDADLPLSFSSVWGESPPPPAKRSTQKIAIPVLPKAERRWPKVAAAAVALLGVSIGGWLMAGPSPSAMEEGRSRSEQLKRDAAKQPRFRLATSAAASAAAGAPKSAALSGAPTTTAQMMKRRGGGGGGSSARDADPAVLKAREKMGPTGATVEIDGDVVAVNPGCVIVRCKRKLYVVRTTEKAKVGGRLKTSGVVAGYHRNGMVFVDGTS